MADIVNNDMDVQKKYSANLDEALKAAGKKKLLHSKYM